MKLFKKNPDIPLRVKLFWYLAAFFLFAILLLWTFQVVFMDSFYRMINVGEMKRSAGTLASAIVDSGDINTSAYAVADNSGFCVSIYRIKDGSGSLAAEAHVKNGCAIHNIVAGEDLSRIYTETADHGGKLVSDLVGKDGPDGNRSILYSRLISKDKADYLLLLNAEALPVGTMSSTITVQLFVITVILLVGAAILAITISLKITRPVSDLCREAEDLAVGDYNVTFTRGDISELNKLGDTLGHAASELERADKMKRELIANITHDLRTPLTMISGYSEVMRDIPGEITPENIQVIIDESARLSALVSDVLEVSKAQNGTMVLNSSVFSLTESVKAAAERYNEMLRVRGYTVTYESDGKSATVNGDETKIMQAFCNLLNNGVNFTGEDKRVTVRQTVLNGVCRTEITDSGSGIPSDELEMIWDRYYRARDRHQKGVPGSGLGLSIVKHIMLLHKADFGVISTVGKGSTFWFELKVESE